ncbi:bleomycin resistance protein [Brevibacillus parabrevis]|uniref:VOC family protein n=1 Tax=Brevibacillus parabrevis TaxID=54914 RepID=UPI0007ABA82D|nr:glyoxalase/bleomycin resistance/extradiol dioxygenase family protein [Brevibacillus parabrevis]KZE47163.1 bleomycin resistance protein [Brevibacillus parabrevis]
MKWQKVTFTTTMPEEMLTFYTNVLQMPLVERSERSFSVRVGDALLVFQRAAEKPFYHFACGIAETAFDAYAKVIQEHRVVLRHKDGQEIMQSYTWKGKQLYFSDPEGNILEMLAFPSEAKTSWLSIQEIGMPVPDVPAYAASLQSIPLPHTFEPESATFRFYGDQDGVLVLVKENRPWFPTDRGATIHPILVEAASDPGQPRHFQPHPQLPYRITY